MQGVLIFLGLAVLSAIGWHYLLKKYVVALLGATFTTTVLFQVANYLHLGYLDPFFIIAMISSGAVALAISALVGMPFVIFRRKSEIQNINGTNLEPFIEKRTTTYPNLPK